MDNGTLVVVLGFFGTMVTGAASVAVAIIVNRREKTQSAETALEQTLRERLVLKDEQLADCRQDLAAEKLKRADAEARADRLQQAQDQARAEENERTDHDQR